MKKLLGMMAFLLILAGNVNAFVVPDNSFLVTATDYFRGVSTVSVFDQSGLLLDSLDVPYLGVLDKTPPVAGDLIFHDNKYITIYNGTIESYLSTYDLTQNSWTHPTSNDLSVNNGGIDRYGNSIYLADSAIYHYGSEGVKIDPKLGIVRFDLDNNNFQQKELEHETIDISVGSNGLVYALDRNYYGQKLLIMDPLTLEIFNEILVPDSPNLLQDQLAAVVISKDGRIFLAGTDKIYEINENGTIIQEIDFDYVRDDVYGGISDLDIFNDQLIVADSFGSATIYDFNLTQLNRFTVGTPGGMFIEPVVYNQRGNTVPEPSTILLFGSAIFATFLRKRKSL